MEFRKDITDFLIKELGGHYKKKVFKFYEQDGKLYRANYNIDSPNRIDSYTAYSLLWFYEGRALKPTIEKKFNVTFTYKTSKKEHVVCRCGETDMFSGKYGDYEFRLVCNACGNDFSVYSG